MVAEGLGRERNFYYGGRRRSKIRRRRVEVEELRFSPCQKKKTYLFHFDTSHHLETMKYEARNKTLSLERLNYQNATDRVSVFRATSKLHAVLNRGKKIVIYIIFSSWPWSSLLLIEIFFSPSRKVLNLRFCPVYITVTSSPSILEWAWHKRKVSSRIMGGLDLVSWTKLFFHAPKIYKIYTFCIFF